MLVIRFLLRVEVELKRMSRTLALMTGWKTAIYCEGSTGKKVLSRYGLLGKCWAPLESCHPQVPTHRCAAPAAELGDREGSPTAAAAPLANVSRTRVGGVMMDNDGERDFRYQGTTEGLWREEGRTIQPSSFMQNLVFLQTALSVS